MSDLLEHLLFLGRQLSLKLVETVVYMFGKLNNILLSPFMADSIPNNESLSFAWAHKMQMDLFKCFDIHKLSITVYISLRLNLCA